MAFLLVLGVGFITLNIYKYSNDPEIRKFYEEYKEVPISYNTITKGAFAIYNNTFREPILIAYVPIKELKKFMKKEYQKDL